MKFRALVSLLLLTTSAAFSDYVSRVEKFVADHGSSERNSAHGPLSIAMLPDGSYRIIKWNFQFEQPTAETLPSEEEASVMGLPAWQRERGPDGKWVKKSDSDISTYWTETPEYSAAVSRNHWASNLITLAGKYSLSGTPVNVTALHLAITESNGREAGENADELNSFMVFYQMYGGDLRNVHVEPTTPR